MKITHKQLRRIIKEELSRTLDEGRYTGGVKVGDSVWLKDNRDKGQGVVRGKYKDLQMGHIISVQWETGETSRHIPSALATSQPMASTWQQRDDDPFTFKIDTYPPDIDEPADQEPLMTPESMIAQYKEDSWAWQKARNDFYNFAVGDDPDSIRDKYYPGWTNLDFIDVITAVDGSYEEYQNEGTSLKDMPPAWHQILGTCLKGKK